MKNLVSLMSLGMITSLLVACSSQGPTRMAEDDVTVGRQPTEAARIYSDPMLMPAGATTKMPPHPTHGGIRYEDWRFDGPVGLGFRFYLAQGYRRYAKWEDHQHDFDEQEKFLERAEGVERGEYIEPEIIAARVLPAYAQGDLVNARERLMWAFDKGARGKLPRYAANAQVYFDCWMEQQEENIQQHDVYTCRKAFEDNMAILMAELTPKPEPVVPLTPPPCRVDCCPKPACPSSPISYIVYFDFDHDDLTEKAIDTLELVVKAVRERKPARVLISGHADRSGSNPYNEELSKRRLDRVLKTLRDAGIEEKHLVVGSWFGETRPRVATPDGEKNQENRRVEINFQWQ